MLDVKHALPLLCVLAIAALPLRAQQTQRSSSTLITADEIDRMRTAGTAFDAVQFLRPRWLQARGVLQLPGASSGDMQLAQVHVYLDDRDMGGIEYLRTIPAERVSTLRFISITEAGARYGPSAGPGIVVTLK